MFLRIKQAAIIHKANAAVGRGLQERLNCSDPAPLSFIAVWGLHQAVGVVAVAAAALVGALMKIPLAVLQPPDWAGPCSQLTPRWG